MALRKDAKTKLVAGVPLFAGCTKRDLGEIAVIADELHLPAGRTLITEGTRGAEFFVVVEGTVTVTRDGATLAELGPGDHVGEIALVSKVPRTATVVAATPVRVLVITDRAFDGLMRRVPSIAIRVLATLAERLPPDEGG